jgi:hypothetical protein
MTYVHGQDLSDCGRTGGDTQESFFLHDVGDIHSLELLYGPCG